MPFRQAENLSSGSGSVCDRGSGSSSAEEAVALKEKIKDKLHNFIVDENYEAIFSISIGVIDAATFCEGTEECRKKFEFALKQAKAWVKWILYF